MNVTGKITGPTKRLAIGSLMLSIMMLVSILVPSLTPEASASSPCPSYSIQDVFDDPSGNWDGDQINNSDELYNGLNPCIVDTTAFCSGGGNPLCRYYTYTYVGYATACQASINAYPTADYDGDGISNSDEVRNGANPCQHPCPNPTHADLALNPNGSWDNDGISNAIEVSQGTNPCNGYNYATTYVATYTPIYNPCPYYSLAEVNSMPNLDWDNDGVSNADEIRRNTSPCQFNAIQRLPHVTQQRLPHVTTHYQTVYVAPQPVTPVCPRGYPYYHRGTRLCYANPIGPY